jgi:hypothetical protein
LAKPRLDFLRGIRLHEWQRLFDLAKRLRELRIDRHVVVGCKRADLLAQICHVSVERRGFQRVRVETGLTCHCSVQRCLLRLNVARYRASRPWGLAEYLLGLQ